MIHRDRQIGLDLVRCLAIILVLTAHYANNVLFWFDVRAPHGVFVLGDIGISLFLVLSGLLIGRILVVIAEGGPTWGQFLVFLTRRWMRILPLYCFVLALLLIVFPPGANVAEHALQYATMTQSLFWKLPSDWFADSWSITVAHWFYVLFAVGVFFCCYWASGRGALYVPLALVLILPLGLRIFVPAFSNWETGLLTATAFQLDQMGYGVLIALLERREGFQRARLLFFAGMVIAACGAYRLLPLPFHISVATKFSLTALGLALCLPAAARLGRLPAFLSQIVTAVSTRSYAIYLIHSMILVNVAQTLQSVRYISSPAAVALTVVLTAALAEAMWRYIERPLMTLRPSQPLADVTPPTPPSRPMVMDRLLSEIVRQLDSPPRRKD